MVAPPTGNPYGFDISDRTKMTSNLFGRAVLPSSSVGSYVNQQLAGLANGTRATVGAPDTQARQSMLDRTPQQTVGFGSALESGQRIGADIAKSNAKVRQTLQVAAQRRRQAAAASGGGGGGAGVGARPTGAVGGTSGPAVSRIQTILKGFPGLRITEIGGNRDYDVAHGVARVPTSYHYDRANPAIDIAGSTADLDRLYRELVRQGGWRQILWRTAGHYDHLHVA